MGDIQVNVQVNRHQVEPYETASIPSSSASKMAVFQLFGTGLRDVEEKCSFFKKVPLLSQGSPEEQNL